MVPNDLKDLSTENSTNLRIMKLFRNRHRSGTKVSKNKTMIYAQSFEEHHC